MAIVFAERKAEIELNGRDQNETRENTPLYWVLEFSI